MARYPRITQKIFASTSGFEEVGQVGSRYNNTPLYTTNLTTIQALSNYLEGWYSVAIGQNAPTMQDMNALFLLLTSQLAYILQAGIAEWDSGTTYFSGDICQENGIIYRSLLDNNLNNDPSISSNWGPPILTGVTTLNAMSVSQEVTSGKTLTIPNPTINSGVTLTVDLGANFLGFGSLVVNGTVTVNGTLRMI